LLGILVYLLNKMRDKNKNFNMVIVGTGGQGLITLLQILAEASLIEGYDVKTSELHGLSQRGGSVEVHIRFGKKVYSPMVAQAKADLVLGLETQEALKGVYFAGPRTNFLINKHIIPIPLQKPFSEADVLKSIKKVSKRVEFVSATQITQEKLGTGVAAGIYLISLAVFKKLIPLKPASISRAIKKTIPGKYLELNLKTFNLAKG
jgi:indolepyruvate ferredoxin oxidoreductase beta subunit